MLTQTSKDLQHFDVFTFTISCKYVFAPYTLWSGISQCSYLSPSQNESAQAHPLMIIICLVHSRFYIPLSFLVKFLEHQSTVVFTAQLVKQLKKHSSILYVRLCTRLYHIFNTVVVYTSKYEYTIFILMLHKIQFSLVQEIVNLI